MTLKIGKINFTNLFPIFYYLEKFSKHLEGYERWECVEGVPSKINHCLREKIIDIGPASSIEYLRNERDYFLVEGHSVSAEGPIKSILLFSTVPIEKLKEKTVLTTSQSETSTALLKIILREFYGINAKTEISSYPLKVGLSQYPAYLLIGDDALHENFMLKEKNIDKAPYVYDLGTIWYKHTGLPFVFALWFGRRERFFNEEHIYFKNVLDMAKENAFSNLRQVAEVCSLKSGFKSKLLVDYWNTISYDLTDKHFEGIELFKKLL